MDYHELGQQTVIYRQVYKHRAFISCNLAPEDIKEETRQCQHYQEIIELKNEIFTLRKENSDLKEKIQRISTQPQLQINLLDPAAMLSEDMSYWNREIITEIAKEFVSLSFAQDLH